MNPSHSKTYKNLGNQDVYNSITKSNCTILDIGCGTGALAQKLVCDGHIVDGITISESEKDIVSTICRNVYIHNLENGLPKDINQGYDYIICSHVLEHISYPLNLLHDIKTKLKPNGKLVIALPNLMHYKSRLELLKGNFNYQESGVWDYTHFRWYTYDSAQKLLQNHGFVLEKTWVSGDIPFLSIFKFIPFKFRKKLFNILCTISKGLFGGQLLFIAKK